MELGGVKKKKNWDCKQSKNIFAIELMILEC
jgi:hypothetical protein